MVIISFRTITYLLNELFFLAYRNDRTFKNRTHPGNGSAGNTTCYWFFHNITLIKMLGLVASILIFQPFAVVVGLGLGINPFPMMLIMCSIGISVIFVLFGICDMYANRSEWTRKHLEKIEAITQNSELFRKYGIVTLIPFIRVPGIGLMDAF